LKVPSLFTLGIGRKRHAGSDADAPIGESGAKRKKRGEKRGLPMPSVGGGELSLARIALETTKEDDLSMLKRKKEASF